jgi:tetratricopeptide (TPR) repeat protein
MLKNKKILFIIFLILAFIIAVFFLYQKNNQLNLPKSNLFKVTDDAGKVLLQENTDLTSEARQLYENRAKEAEANIAKGGNIDFMATNYNNLGMYQTYLGKYKEAYGSYFKVLEMNNTVRVSWLGLGDLLIKMKAYISAANAYDRAMNLNPYDPLVYSKIANLHKITGKADKVKQIYENGLKQTESSSILLDEYANWLVEIKDYKQAIEILQKQKAKQPANSAAIDRKIEQVKKEGEIK